MQVPQALVAQLRPGGRLLIPVGPPGEVQQLMVVDKVPECGQLVYRSAMQVLYVPLVSREHQLQAVP